MLTGVAVRPGFVNIALNFLTDFNDIIKRLAH